LNFFCRFYPLSFSLKPNLHKTNWIINNNTKYLQYKMVPQNEYCYWYDYLCVADYDNGEGEYMRKVCCLLLFCAYILIYICARARSCVFVCLDFRWFFELTFGVSKQLVQLIIVLIHFSNERKSTKRKKNNLKKNMKRNGFIIKCAFNKSSHQSIKVSIKNSQRHGTTTRTAQNSILN
jgi:hypothetical protein